METKNTSSTPVTTILFDKATMAFTLKQFIEQNGLSGQMKPGNRIVTANCLRLTGNGNELKVEVINDLRFLQFEEAFCVRVPTRNPLSGMTLLVSKAEALNFLNKVCGIAKPDPQRLNTLAMMLVEREEAEKTWKEVEAFYREELSPCAGRFDDANPCRPWTSKELIMKLGDFLNILPVRGKVFDEIIAEFSEKRRDFEPAFKSWIEKQVPADGPAFIELFRDFCAEYGENAPRLPLDVAFGAFGDRTRYAFVLTGEFTEFAKAVAPHRSVRIINRLSAYSFWLWCQYEEDLRKREQDALKAVGADEVVATSLASFLVNLPVADRSEKGDRRNRKHDRKKSKRGGREVTERQFAFDDDHGNRD